MKKKSTQQIELEQLDDILQEVNKRVVFSNYEDLPYWKEITDLVVSKQIEVESRYYRPKLTKEEVIKLRINGEDEDLFSKRPRKRI